MRKLALLTVVSSLLGLSSCLSKGPNPDDPYEAINRKTYAFNKAFDATFLKPPARFYKAVTPAPVRKGVDNFYNNINMIPTVANDLLQGEWRFAIKDSWRFIINTTMGIGGVFDPAAMRCGLPPHSNDLGLTFAKWGDKKSPYIVIPFLGPSTFRDGMGLLFEYPLLTPYPYIRSDAVVYGLLGFRYIDLRAQLFDTERLMQEALDPYSFMRDAYLQHRNYIINGNLNNPQVAAESAYLSDFKDDALGGDYVDE